MTTLLNSELETLKRNLKMQQNLFIALFVCTILACIITYYMGYIDCKLDSLNRNSKIIESKKQCLDQSDVKFIILGYEN